MEIVFTLCSNNYLPQAKTLGDSLRESNPGYQFIIGLTDELHPDIDYGFFNNFTIIPVAEIGIDNFDELWKKYNIVEFNTCVKASFFKYLFKTYPNKQSIFYLDPDIVVYHSLSVLEDELKQHNILLTPHICTPIPIDGKTPGENLFLNYGIYNLGFVGIHRNCFTSCNFLDWWEERTLTTGFERPCEGIFVDQLWINLVPLFYDKVKILYSYGFNAAPWNLHERTIAKYDTGSIIMNDGSPLYFFHFSNFKFSEPDNITNLDTYNRCNFTEYPQLIPLYNDYCERLINNRVKTLSAIKCVYIIYQRKYKEEQAGRNKVQTLVRTAKKVIREVLPPIVFKAIRFIIK